jgi:hypothetical protein
MFVRNGLAMLVLLLSFALLLPACNSDPVGHRVPVRGKVMVGGKALKTGSVAFWPDAEKGNQSKFEAAGQIDGEGNYELFTKEKPGAPVGVYKVTVTAQEPGDPKNPYSRPKLLVPAAFTTKENTPARIEVVNNPAPQAYDIVVK